MKYLLMVFLLGFCRTDSRAQEVKPAVPTAPTVPAVAKVPSVTRTVGVDKFAQLCAGTNVVILDVRTSAEYAEGHLPGSVLLDYRAADFVEKVAKLDKSKEYLVHCAGGGRSARACTKMESLGFTNLVNLDGGLGAWKEAGKAVAK